MAREHADHRFRTEVRYNTSRGLDTELFLRCQVDNVECVPGTATVVLYDSSGTTVQSSTACTIDATATSPIVTLQIDTTATTTYTKAEGYQAKWTWSYEGDTHYDRTFFDVVSQPLEPTLVDDDLVAAENELRNILPTGESSWSAKIRLAWQAIDARIRAQCNQDGHGRPALVAGYGQFFVPHLYLTLSMIYEDMPAGAEKADRYREQYELATTQTLSGLSYDEDDSGDVEDERETFGASVKLTR